MAPHSPATLGGRQRTGRPPPTARPVSLVAGQSGDSPVNQMNQVNQMNPMKPGESGESGELGGEQDRRQLDPRLVEHEDRADLPEQPPRRAAVEPHLRQFAIGLHQQVRSLLGSRQSDVQ